LIGAAALLAGPGHGPEFALDQPLAGAAVEVDRDELARRKSTRAGLLIGRRAGDEAWRATRLKIL